MLAPLIINGTEYDFESFIEHPMPTVMKVRLIRLSGVQPEVGTLTQGSETWVVMSVDEEHRGAVEKIAQFLTDRRQTADPKVLERKSDADGAPFVVTCACGQKHEVRALPRLVCCDCGSWLRART